MKLFKSKTFWTAIVGVLVAIVSWILGELSLWAVIMSVVAAFGVIFYRDSIDQNLKSLLNKFKWFKSRTVWTMVAAILGTITAMIAGEIEVSAGLMAIAGEFVTIFLRSAQAPE